MFDSYCYYLGFQVSVHCCHSLWTYWRWSQIHLWHMSSCDVMCNFFLVLICTKKGPFTIRLNKDNWEKQVWGSFIRGTENVSVTTWSSGRPEDFPCLRLSFSPSYWVELFCKWSPVWIIVAYALFCLFLSVCGVLGDCFIFFFGAKILAS